MIRPTPTTVTLGAAQALARLAAVEGSRGWCTAVAGILEATAEKPGNVHPRRAFPDLTYDDLVAAAVASAPIMDRAPARGLGDTILDAVAAARAAADTNANLGIILLTAPLAAVPDGEPLAPAAIERVLARVDQIDAERVWKAISLARPGGMGRENEWDLAGPPPRDLLLAMRAAAHRDQIARLWATGFAPLFAGPVADLDRAIASGMSVVDAIIDCHVRQLAREPDSLIARKHGAAAADMVSSIAAMIPPPGTDGRSEAIARLDDLLRFPVRRNPGTTADLIAASLYILIRTGRLVPALVPPVSPP